MKSTSRAADLETIWFGRIASPVGPLLLAVSARGLVALHFDTGQSPPRANKAQRWLQLPDKIAAYAAELEQYFAGQLRTFTLPLDLRGTEFQKNCWHALLQIPYGETRSYADIARSVGKPSAFRAVGMANHDNPVAIMVPCHRVVTSDGKLGGYGGGLATKEKLLKLEGARVRG
jgi:methylated-DNA-[protein]-cysteine S-methyltransferase